MCEHPCLGFEIQDCHIRTHGYVSGVVLHSSASRICNVRRKYIGAFVVSVNDIAVFTAKSIVTALHTVAASDEQSFTIVFAPERYIPVADRHLEQPLHLSVEQLRTISIITIQTTPTMMHPMTTTSSFCFVQKHDDAWRDRGTEPWQFHLPHALKALQLG